MSRYTWHNVCAALKIEFLCRHCLTEGMWDEKVTRWFAESYQWSFHVFYHTQWSSNMNLDGFLCSSLHSETSVLFLCNDQPKLYWSFPFVLLFASYLDFWVFWYNRRTTALVIVLVNKYLPRHVRDACQRKDFPKRYFLDINGSRQSIFLCNGLGC